MKVTAIIKNVSDAFFEGFGESITGLDNMSDLEKLNYLMNAGVSKPHMVTTKVGSNMFRDKVELNQLRHKDFSIAYKLENRKGYKLATFELTAK